MPQPVNCRYFYGDYFRGNKRETCRLLEASPGNERPWKRKLCNSCPVPDLLLTSNCPSLLLEVEVKKRFLSERVEVTFSVCNEHLIELDDPQFCPQCVQETEEQGGCSGP